MDIIHSCEEFNRLLARERAACDRSAHQFSVLVFDDLAARGPGAIRQLVRTLARRVREIDEIGWFDAASIGVLLPFTPSEGAHTLAEDICVKLPESQRAYTIYTYPGQWFPHQPPSSGRGERDKASPARTPVLKRALDTLGALFALICLSPLFIGIAAIIKVVSPGPAMLKQVRLGRYGQPFTIWKFRTMRLNADDGLHQDHLTRLIETDAPMVKLDGKRDPRIFPFGRLLRRCCLDELPQLINVIRGEMSLVGPRPCLPYEAEAYRPWQTARFDAIPGMTGLWQVSGKNKTPFAEMMRLDIRYAKKRHFWLDVWILLKTIPAVASEAAHAASRRKQPRVT
jgi:lipopolysaccharide/colanic/teichoic acid biosynthesis glycosyltransferase